MKKQNRAHIDPCGTQIIVINLAILNSVSFVISNVLFFSCSQRLNLPYSPEETAVLNVEIRVRRRCSLNLASAGLFYWPCLPTYMLQQLYVLLCNVCCWISALMIAVILTCSPYAS